LEKVEAKKKTVGYITAFLFFCEKETLARFHPEIS
jgi:hypothetical protein